MAIRTTSAAISVSASHSPRGAPSRSGVRLRLRMKPITISAYAQANISHASV